MNLPGDSFKREVFFVCVCVYGVCVCVVNSAPVCLQAGKATASHFWLALVW